MTPEFLMGLAREAVEMTLLISLPMLGIGLIVGLVVSIFQAVTQVQEMTLTFVPKIVAVLLGLLFFAPWMISKMTAFARHIITIIPTLVH
ncbi:MAG: flagellar biosynthesis protein FliQ [Deltaproteobacteria bacterium]|nr:flagellar biosynthesis protein FliQ [Deltaproteobacteria bacterium]MBW2069717.1 flagellar biosynthesis protein FliQ [Deltaproteobacteria bacterium]